MHPVFLPVNKDAGKGITTNAVMSDGLAVVGQMPISPPAKNVNPVLRVLTTANNNDARSDLLA